MTPFDATALLAMLLTFYPAVSVAALQQARRERPEYFAGGTLFGSQGEKFRLPDGRGFDLIFDVDGPAARWQVLEVFAGADDVAGDAFFALTPGPLSPLDGSTWPAPVARTDFQDLVAGALSEIAGAVTGLERATLTMGELPGAGALEAALAAIDDGDAAIGDGQRVLDTIRPEELVTTTAGHMFAIDVADRVYDEPPPSIPGFGEPPLYPGDPALPPDIDRPTTNTEE